LGWPSSLPNVSFLRHVSLPNSLTFYVDCLLGYLKTIIFIPLILIDIFIPYPLILFSISLPQASIDIYVIFLLLLTAIFPTEVEQKVHFAKQPNRLKAELFDKLVGEEPFKVMEHHLELLIELSFILLQEEVAR